MHPAVIARRGFLTLSAVGAGTLLVAPQMILAPGQRLRRIGGRPCTDQTPAECGSISHVFL